MHPSDLQQEYNRLSQAYREMADEELESVAAEAYDLTDIARQALNFEISSRGRKFPLILTPPPSDDDAAPVPPTDDGFVPADEDLVVIERAENMQDLLNTKSLLDRAQIECFLGAEKVHAPGELTSPFEGGVAMRIWRPAYAQAVELLSAQKPGYAERLNEHIPDSDIRAQNVIPTESSSRSWTLVPPATVLPKARNIAGVVMIAVMNGKTTEWNDEPSRWGGRCLISAPSIEW